MPLLRFHQAENRQLSKLPETAYSQEIKNQMTDIKERQKFLREENRRYSDKLTSVPQDEWPAKNDRMTSYPVAAKRSRHFVCQIYDDGGFTRLTFSRTMIKGDGNYLDGITWDELVGLKNEAGYGDALAIEFYPPDFDVVNVANMRHLFIIKDGRLPPYWKK